MDINWDGLKPRNLFADYKGGLEAGREMKTSNLKREAMNLFATDPAAAEQKFIAAGDYQTAEALAKRRERERTQRTQATVGAQVSAGNLDGARKSAAEAGDFEMVSAIAKMDKDQRELLLQQTGTLASAVYPLRGKSPQEIAAQWPQIKAGLARYQIDPEKLNFDPSQPGAIDQLVAETLELKGVIDQANKDRDFGQKEDEFAHRKEHDAAMVGIARQNAGTSASNAQTSRMAYEARRAAGGFGTPGAVGGIVPDADVDVN